MPDNFEAIATQEEFDTAIKPYIDKNTADVTAEVTRKYEGWVSPEDAERSAGRITELTAQVAELTAKNQAAQLSMLRTKVAHESGLPYELAQRLQGNDEKELRADAESLARLTAPKPVPSPGFVPETQSAAVAGTAAEAAFRTLAAVLR